MTLYRSFKGKLFVDLDDLYKIYSLTGTEPGLEKMRIKLIKPQGSHPEIGLQRGVDAESVSKVLTVARHTELAVVRCVRSRPMPRNTIALLQLMAF